ncbi:MAG: hypothetical protein NW237_00010 [Cyanobacteriota bacterium]|nr:hypothetical protein [Cyanobacteriota bacterium]
MRVDEFLGTLPDISAPSIPEDLDPADENALEQYIYDVILHASRVEAKLNESRGRDDRINRFATTINESGAVKSTLTGRVDLSTIVVS